MRHFDDLPSMTVLSAALCLDRLQRNRDEPRAALQEVKKSLASLLEGPEGLQGKSPSSVLLLDRIFREVDPRLVLTTVGDIAEQVRNMTELLEHLTTHSWSETDRKRASEFCLALHRRMLAESFSNRRGLAA